MPATTENRFMTMLERVGLDLSIVERVRKDAILKFVFDANVKEARRRCRECMSVELCERWLSRMQDVGNGFCPNAEIIDELKMVCSTELRP